MTPTGMRFTFSETPGCSDCSPKEYACCIGCRKESGRMLVLMVFARVDLKVSGRTSCQAIPAGDTQDAMNNL